MAYFNRLVNNVNLMKDSFLLSIIATSIIIEVANDQTDFSYLILGGSFAVAILLLIHFVRIKLKTNQLKFINLEKLNSKE